MEVIGGIGAVAVAPAVVPAMFKASSNASRKMGSPLLVGPGASELPY